MNETQRDWSQPIKGSDFTPELARDFLNEMCRRGCSYEVEEVANKVWHDSGFRVPAFYLHEKYRLPPIPRTEPFTQATVPKGALWRYREEGFWRTAVLYQRSFVKVSEGGDCAYDALQLFWQYSTDGGQTWHKAEMEVK